MFKTLTDAFKIKDVRNKLLLTLLLLLIFRLGCWIPVPGLEEITFTEGQTFMQLLSSLSGGALSQGTFLALGVSPYITSSIIVQLLSVVIPSWERLSKEGAEGRKKIEKYTKIVALIIATAQAIGIVVGFKNQGYVNLSYFKGIPEWMGMAFIVLMLVAGAMFTVWLGEKISEIGIGNGMSLLIFVGILSSAGTALFTNFQNIAKGGEVAQNAIWQLILFLVTMLVVFGFVVFVDGGERKVPVQYAKQIKGRKMYGGQSTYIPVRVNANGVMPIIFASSIITFPQMICSIFDAEASWGFTKWWAKWLGAGSWIYTILLGLLILAFAYFYSMLNFNTDDISKQIQHNGGFIPGIRPGKPTANYLSGISKRITLFGAIFLAIMAIVPTYLFKAIGTTGLTSAFGATAILIVVSVALEFDKQLEAQMLMRNYRGFLK
ncbi:MAG: preprotein translocase subunit SecY [Clostridia bacterium]|nr:preprotein translocase subunit SecY [Clostridia bacterium]